MANIIETFPKGGGATSLSNLMDVELTSPAEGDLLQYNSTSGEWENSSMIPQKLDSIPRPNLLKNWNFANPVNTQGKSSYTGPGTGIFYPVFDHWLYAWYFDITLNSGYINFSVADGSHDAIVKQIIEHGDRLYGKKLTASCLMRDGTLFCKTFTCPTAGNRQMNTIVTGLNFNFDHNSASGELSYWFRKTGTNPISVNIVAVKLEIGEGQTLCHKENGVWVLNEVENTEPWQNTNQISAMQEAGAVNRVIITTKTQTISGVTVTVEDGVITLNGTDTSASRHELILASSLVLGRKFLPSDIPLKLSGYSGYGGATENIAFYVNYSINGGWTSACKISYDGSVSPQTFTLPSARTAEVISLYYNPGTVFNNLTIKPMVYDARLVNPPYQPFTMTNRELTDAIDAVDDWENISSQCTFAHDYFYDTGYPYGISYGVRVNKKLKLCTFSMVFRKNPDAEINFANVTALLSLPNGYSFTSVRRYVCTPSFKDFNATTTGYSLEQMCPTISTEGRYLYMTYSQNVTLYCKRIYVPMTTLPLEFMP